MARQGRYFVKYTRVLGNSGCYRYGQGQTLFERRGFPIQEGGNDLIRRRRAGTTQVIHHKHSVAARLHELQRTEAKTGVWLAEYTQFK